jgi:predicted transcriptional regulator YheO
MNPSFCYFIRAKNSSNAFSRSTSLKDEKKSGILCSNAAFPLLG